MTRRVAQACAPMSGSALTVLATALSFAGAAPLNAQTNTMPTATPAVPETTPATAGVPAVTGQQQIANPGDIVVTALKGAVSVQRAPVTVNVVSGVAITNKGVTSVEQLTTVVPGVRINQAPGGIVNPVVRGLGSSPSNNSFEQTVGLFVDGVFAGHPRDYAAALFDLDRVELLKGTQSAVVGKNTSVGALSLVTRKPTSEFGGEATYYHEFELGTDTATLAVNTPISDKLALRVAGIYSDEGGWMKSVLAGGHQPNVRRGAIRATVRFRPTADLEWLVSGQYSDLKQKGYFFHSDVDAFGNARRGAIAGGDLGYTNRHYETRNTMRPGFSYRGLDYIGSTDQAARFNSTINYTLDTLTLTAVTGYSRFNDKLLFDATTSIGSPTLRAGYETDRSFSQELRVATDAARPLSLIAGAYYYSDHWSYEDLFDFIGTRLFAPSLGGAFTSRYFQRTNTVSAFGQLRYKFNDKLQLNGSVRYEHFKKSGRYTPRVTLRPGTYINVYGPYNAFKLSDADNYFDFSGQLQYFMTSRVNAYVSFSTGTKGFGYVATPASPGGVVTNPYFRPEKSETLEAGVKVGFGRGSNFNVAFFNTRLRDYQIGVNLGTNFLIRNDQIRSRGVDMNLNLVLLEGLRAGVTATYADVRKLAPRPANSIHALPFAPKWSGIANLSYERPLGSNLRLNTNVSAEFRTRQHLSDVATFIIPAVPGRVRTDLRIGVEHEPSRIELALVIRNLFDVYALNYGFSQAGSAGAAQVSEELPRTIGLQATARF